MASKRPRPPPQPKVWCLCYSCVLRHSGVTDGSAQRIAVDTVHRHIKRYGQHRGFDTPWVDPAEQQLQRYPQPDAAASPSASSRSGTTRSTPASSPAATPPSTGPATRRQRLTSPPTTPTRRGRGPVRGARAPQADALDEDPAGDPFLPGPPTPAPGPGPGPSPGPGPGPGPGSAGARPSSLSAEELRELEDAQPGRDGARLQPRTQVGAQQHCAGACMRSIGQD